MTLSLRVFTPEGIIQVADLAYELMGQIYNKYGDCPVAVYDREDVWGLHNDCDTAEAYELTTITRLEW